jgi:hypothetical protein
MTRGKTTVAGYVLLSAAVGSRLIPGESHGLYLALTIAVVLAGCMTAGCMISYLLDEVKHP